MNLFKKKLATFSALLALLSVSCAAVNAAGIADNAVLGKTSNMDIVRTSSKRMDVFNQFGWRTDSGYCFGDFIDENIVTFFGILRFSKHIFVELVGIPVLHVCLFV